MASSKTVVTDFANLNQEDYKNLVKRDRFKEVGNFVNDSITVKSLNQVLYFYKD